MIDIQAYTPSRFWAQLEFSQGVVDNVWEFARNTWEFATSFDTGARYIFPKYQKQRNYTDPFIEWHAKRYAAIRDAEMKSNILGMYPTPSGI